MLIIAITVVHVIMCLILIAIVLLQTGKGANVGAAFGGASNTLFGAAGPASFLNKLTTVAAIVFMLTSFTLAVVSSRGTKSSTVLDATETQQEQPLEQITTEETGEETAEESAVSEEETAEEPVVSEEESSSTEQPVVEEVQEENTDTTEGSE
jgi:preprotein translocase subunit SecG